MYRRQFIKFGLSAFYGLSVEACSSRLLNHPGQQLFIYSGFDDKDGRHHLAQLNLQTQQIKAVKTTFRGHDLLVHPSQAHRVILFGRRPETQSCEVDFQTLKTTPIQASANRHFYGHGCFSIDHQYLFTTENNFNQARGVVGIRDAITFQHLGEFPSYGVGPHDIQLLPDGQTLVIANGGIETHPDFGRRKLNLNTMRPSLVYIDIASGNKLAQYSLADHQLSIRHLLVTSDGDVGVALQYQGDLYQKQPPALLAWQKSGQDLKMLSTSTSAFKTMKGYMADLAYADTSNILLATSPRGNQVTLWDMNNQRHLKNIPFSEPSGVLFNRTKNRFLISNSAGQILELDVQSLEVTEDYFHTPAIKWDNHMVSVNTIAFQDVLSKSV